MRQDPLPLPLFPSLPSLLVLGTNRMDVLSHFFLPFTAALFVLGLHRRPRGVVDVARRQTRIAYAVVFGMASLAPDLDSAIAWARHIDGLYWTQHRGFSHTVLGAPVFAAVSTAMLHGLAVWRPARFGRYRFRPGFVPVAIVGSWVHLLFDMITYTGVPALWPFSFERTGINLFHYIIIWFVPIILLVLALHLWGKVRLHHVAWTGVVLVAVMILIAGARVHYAPRFDDASGFWDPAADGHDEGSEVLVFSRNSIVQYTVVWPVPEGWMAALYDTGRWSGEPVLFEERIENGTEEAIRRTQDTNGYRGFRMGVFGPVVTEAVWLDETTVQVVYTDVAARFESSLDPAWTPAVDDDEWGYVAFHVTGGDVKTLQEGW